MMHYEKHELELLLRGQTLSFKRWCCRRHLAACPRCRALVDELVEDELFLKQIRKNPILNLEIPADEIKLNQLDTGRVPDSGDAPERRS